MKHRRTEESGLLVLKRRLVHDPGDWLLKFGFYPQADNCMLQVKQTTQHKKLYGRVRPRQITRQPSCWSSWDNPSVFLLSLCSQSDLCESTVISVFILTLTWRRWSYTITWGVGTGSVPGVGSCCYKMPVSKRCEIVVTKCRFPNIAYSKATHELLTSTAELLSERQLQKGVGENERKKETSDLTRELWRRVVT